MASPPVSLIMYLSSMKKASVIVFLVIGSLLSCEKGQEKEFPKWSAKDRALLVSEFQTTKFALHDLVDLLSYEQWNFKPDSSKWSIAYIVEHLQLQEDMHYREVRIISMQPPRPKEALKTVGNDEKVMAYVNDPKKGIADWNVTPLGRWPTKNLALMAFDRSRDQMIQLVKTTEADLRQQVTFRNLSDEEDFRNVRNLHQILLTTVAHTKRHMIQIEQVMNHPNFPK